MHTHTHTQRRVFHAQAFQCHGQATCLSQGPFLSAVCLALADSGWKTCLNESAHQLHQHILTSLPPPSSLEAHTHTHHTHTGRDNAFMISLPRVFPIATHKFLNLDGFWKSVATVKCGD